MNAVSKPDQTSASVLGQKHGKEQKKTEAETAESKAESSVSSCGHQATAAAKRNT